MNYLTYNDLARATGIGAATLRVWNQRGKLPPSEKIGTTRVWRDTAELRTWIEENDDRPDPT